MACGEEGKRVAGDGKRECARGRKGTEGRLSGDDAAAVDVGLGVFDT